MSNSPNAWSYSALEKFENCPFQYQQVRVTKTVVEPQSPEMAWGNQVHKALEDRLIKNVPLPDNISMYEPMAANVQQRAVGGVLKAEEKLAINREFKPVTYFAKGPLGVWVRSITDFSIEKGNKAFVGDWKTGKPKTSSGQLKLSAAMVLHHRPHIQTVTTAFVWLNAGTVTPATFTRDDIPAIWQDFTPRVQRLDHALQTNKFPKRPSGLCKKWCPVPQSMCEHSGKPG